MGEVKKVVFNDTQQSKKDLLIYLDELKEMVNKIPEDEFYNYGFLNIMYNTGKEIVVNYHNCSYANISVMRGEMQIDLMEMMIDYRIGE